MVESAADHGYSVVVKKTARKQEQRRRQGGARSGKVIKWTIGLAVVALLVYGASQMKAGVAYGEDKIAVVNFSELDEDHKHTALVAANNARCNCGCGMTLAQCVATDSTCPVREANIERIKTIVRNEAGRP